MTIVIKRVYETPSSSDGLRVLVDRLWPRGLSKARARVDHWAKELAPSHALRRWYAHEARKWPEFRRRYSAELRERAEALEVLRRTAGKRRVTLLYGSKEARLNNAFALKRILESRARARPKPRRAPAARRARAGGRR